MFRFQAERVLLRRLGEQDALFEMQEVALRFLHNHISQTDAPEVEIRRIVDMVGIKVSPQNMLRVMTHSSQTSLVVVCAAADEFLDGVADEATALLGSNVMSMYRKRNDKQKVSRLDATLACAKQARSRTPGPEDEPVVCLFKYYEDLRHAVAHPDGRRPKRLDKLHARVAARQEEWEQTFGANPEHYDRLRFDDFVIFTRCTKAMARLISHLLEPTEDELRAAVRPEAEELAKRAVRRRRLGRAVGSLMRTKYGLDEDTASRIGEELARELGG